MSDNAPTILALDFDGVLCDGMMEYFQTSWRTYCQIWKPSDLTPPNSLSDRFKILRPVIEVGWEMPLLLRAILLEVPEDKILQDWSLIAQELLKSEQLNPVDIAQQLDGVRDEWIARDRQGWLELHQFYAGVAQRLRSLQNTAIQPVIVTTKEGRFVGELLQQQNIELSPEWIIGKESRRSKQQTLRELLQTTSNIWFVEDRLQALRSVQQQPDLMTVKLYLASWGYNTPQTRNSIGVEERIKLLSLPQFVQDFSMW